MYPFIHSRPFAPDLPCTHAPYFGQPSPLSSMYKPKSTATLQIQPPYIRQIISAHPNHPTLAPKTVPGTRTGPCAHKEEDNAPRARTRVRTRRLENHSSPIFPIGFLGSLTRAIETIRTPHTDWGPVLTRRRIAVRAFL
jgi:hypothetical protein